MFQRNLNQIWDQLRGKRPQYKNFLNRIGIRELRGINDLSITFNYPVTVLAGPNGCGKSTVLLACACAYALPGNNRRNLSPAALFPNLKTSSESLCDRNAATKITFDYLVENASLSMQWTRGKKWNNNFLGRKNVSQPERKVYLRTLANLTSPSEVRSVLQIGKKEFETEEITVDLIAFAQRILDYRYKQLTLLKKGGRDLLFAQREDANADYSEFHMSAGERALIRLSKDISSRTDTLVLIDEIEAGLHPFTQQQIMLELQRLALRNELQIIVTSHSPVILDCVPPEGRVFLERSGNNVQVKPAYKNIIQKAYYGQSLDKISILCEDEIGEAFLRGILDQLNPKLDLMPEDIIVGRNTGKDEFPPHIRALAKFSILMDFIFVLDGDARSMEAEIKAAAPLDQPIQPIFLPGSDAPERWAWDTLKLKTDTLAKEFGITARDLQERLHTNDRLYDAASDTQTNKIKAKFQAMSESLRRSASDVIRIIAREECKTPSGEMAIFVQELEDQLRKWITRR